MPAPHLEHLFETSGLTIERVGYSSMDVTRLLRDVATALDEGRPVEEMIAERELAEVSFGYGRQKVDELLDRIVAETTPPPAEPEPPTPAVAVAEPMVPATPQPQAASVPVKPDGREVAAAILEARFTTAARTPNDEMDQVDQFLDSLAAAIAAGQDVRPALRGRRLHPAR